MFLLLSPSIPIFSPQLSPRKKKACFFFSFSFFWAMFLSFTFFRSFQSPSNSHLHFTTLALQVSLLHFCFYFHSMYNHCLAHERLVCPHQLQSALNSLCIAVKGCGAVSHTSISISVSKFIHPSRRGLIYSLICESGIERRGSAGQIALWCENSRPELKCG